MSDYLSNFPSNRIGLLTGPAKGGGAFELRPLITANELLAFGGKAVIENANAPGWDVRDIDCLKAAELADQELQTSGEYVVGQENRYVVPHARFALPSFSAEFNQSYYNRSNPVSSGNSILPGSVTMRHALWSKVVNPNRVLTVKNIADGLRSIVPAQKSGDSGLITTYLILGDLPHTFNSDTESQSYVNSDGDEVESFKRASLLNGYFALLQQEWVTQFSKLNTRLKNRNYKMNIYVMIIRNPVLYPEVECSMLGCPQYWNDYDNFVSVIENSKNEIGKRVQFTPVRVPDSGSVAQDLAAMLPAANQTIYLVKD